MFAPSLVLLAFVFVSATRGAVDFNCTFQIDDWYLIGNVYKCEAQVTIVGDSRILRSVQGTHESGKTNDDVNYLLVNDEDLPFIPGNLSTFFKGLIGLQWEYSNLAKISAADLKPFPNLLAFSAQGNKLISIDGDLFQHNPKLRYICLNSNEIQHVGHDLVNNLNDLVDLYFLSNPCVNQYAHKRAAVLRLNNQLPVLCPPLEAKTTTTTTETIAVLASHGFE